MSVSNMFTVNTPIQLETVGEPQELKFTDQGGKLVELKKHEAYIHNPTTRHPVYTKLNLPEALPEGFYDAQVEFYMKDGKMLTRAIYVKADKQTPAKKSA